MAENKKCPSINNYPHYADVRIDLERNESDVYTIVQKIHPDWPENEVVIKRLEGTGGFINKTFICFHRDDVESQNDGMFIRVNDPGLEGILIDRAVELTYL